MARLLDKVRNHDLGVFAIEEIALAEDLEQKLLLYPRPPQKARNHGGKDGKDSRPAAERDRLAQSEQREPEIDRVTHEPVGAGCDDSRVLACYRNQAPGITEFGARPQYDRRACQRN